MSTKLEKQLAAAKRSAASARARARQSATDFKRTAYVGAAGMVLGKAKGWDIWEKVPGADNNSKMLTVAGVAIVGGFAVPKSVRPAAAALADASVAIAAYHMGASEVAGGHSSSSADPEDFMDELRELARGDVSGRVIDVDYEEDDEVGYVSDDFDDDGVEVGAYVDDEDYDD